MEALIRELDEKIDKLEEKELNDLNEKMEQLSGKIRKKLLNNKISDDTRITFSKDKFKINIGGLIFEGNSGKYVEKLSKKTKYCIFADCKARNCLFYHPGRDEREIHLESRSPLMRSFLLSLPEQLPLLYNSFPNLKADLLDFKDRILDGIIRLLWLRSEGINI